jgi:hypothetical protein
MTWCDNKQNDIIFSLQVFIYTTSMIDNKMMWMFKISFENMTTIKSFQLWLKNDYENDVYKMMCHYIDDVVIKLLYNDSKMTINHLIWVQMDIRNHNM